MVIAEKTAFDEHLPFGCIISHPSPFILQKMRVISGTARGHGLKAPRSLKLRPTPARVKEALFSSLAGRMEGSRVLELFAGTGAFGIECLSRGAAEVTLIEKDGRAASLIQSNLQKTRLTDRAHLMRADVRQALDWLGREQRQFDLIFADPPYLKAPEKSVEHFFWNVYLLNSPALRSLLTAEGILLIEHFKKDTRCDSPHFVLTRQFRFGDTIVSSFRHGLMAQPP